MDPGFLEGGGGPLGVFGGLLSRKILKNYPGGIIWRRTMNKVKIGIQKESRTPLDPCVVQNVAL